MKHPFQAAFGEQKREVAYKELGSIKEGLPKVTELFLPALLHLSMAKDDSSVPLWCLLHEVGSQHLSD